MMNSEPETPQAERKLFWLWRLVLYVRPYGRHLVLLALSVVIAGGMNLLAPWPMQILVDHVFSKKSQLPHALRFLDTLPPLAQVSLLALASFLLAVGAAGIYMYGAYRETVLGQRLVLDLRAKLFSHLLRLPLSFHQNRELGDTIYRVADDTWCVHALTLKGVLPLATSSVQLVGLAFLLFQLDWQLAIVALGVMPALLLCVRSFGDRISDLSTDTREKEASLYQILQEVFGVIRVVQLFTRERQERKRFTTTTEEVSEAQLALTRQETWFGLAIDAVTQVGRAAVLLFGGWHVVQGKLTLGQLMVVLAYLDHVYDPITEISSTFGEIQSASANAKRVFEVLDEVPDIQDKPDAIQLPTVRGEIEFDNVRFWYRSGDPVLDGVSFHLRPGETVALVGASGAGKSTIASLIPRLYDVQEGAIRVDGHDVKDLAMFSLRDNVSVVPQEVSLFSGTIRENIRYGRPDASDEEIEQAARMAQAHDFIMRQSDGYDTELGEHGEGLSGGERQRIALARAFLKASPVLILDEPTAALDVDTEAGLMSALATISRHRTTIIIAHRLQTARMADRIIVLERGRIAEMGRPQDLLRANGVYARLCRVSEGLQPGLLLDEVFTELQGV